MMKTKLTLCVILALALGITLAPTLSLAAEFTFPGPPAFTVTYPDRSRDQKPARPEIVWQILDPAGVLIQASVSPVPEGIELKDAAEKAYKPSLEKRQRIEAKVSENKEITLSDGTKAYYSELDWNQTKSGRQFSTFLVSVCKDGKWVYLHGYYNLGNPLEQYIEPMKIVKSLKFK